MRSTNHWVSTAWSHGKTTYHCHLAALRADGQLIFFKNASSGGNKLDETDESVNLSKLIGKQLKESEDVDFLESHDVVIQLATVNDIDKNGRMDELLNSMVKYHHRVSVSCFVF